MSVKSVLRAQSEQVRFRKDEAKLADAVEDIVSVFVDNEEHFRPKDVHSALIRLENTLKAMQTAVTNAGILLDPENLARLEADVADYRRTLGMD